MKVGDLVTVEPAGSGLYLVVERDFSFANVSNDPHWILYGVDVPTITMTEQWIKVIAMQEA